LLLALEVSTKHQGSSHGFFRRRVWEAFVRKVLLSTACVFLTGGACAQQSDEMGFAGEVTAEAPNAEFELVLDAGELVTLTTSSAAGFDTVLVLLGLDGKPIAENDDRAPGVLSSQIIHMPQATGTYTAIVSGFGGAEGSFELSVDQGLDVGLSDEGRVLEEDVVALDENQTSAQYEFDLAADDILVATTYALTESLDTILNLSAADGEVLTQNDDSGDGSLNSQLVFQAVEAGRYTVEVSSFSGSDVGELVVSLALDPNADVPFNFDTIEGTELATHEGEITNDVTSHDYDVQLEAGQTLFALGDTTSGDLDVVLRLMGPDGYPVAMNDDRGDGSLNSGFAFTAPSTDTYTLSVGRYRGGASTGEFRLSLSSVDESVVGVLAALLENAVNLSGPELVFETDDFRVHYTLEGVDASSTEYAQSVGDALQGLLDVQVSQGGWAEPLRDADGRYRAYVADADGSMGVTQPVQIVFDNPNTDDVRETAAARTLFIIDNDFVGMGKEAPVDSLMRATATHELNHVIQFGYDAEEALNWLYEATASWVETTTVGHHQDATDYVDDDYAAPELCWTTSVDGHDYAQWTLLESMANSYGDGFIVDIWENSVELDGFETLSATLAVVDSDIPATIQRWRAQNYALAYELAPLFDSTVRLHHTLEDEGRWTSKGGVEELGANYVALDLEGRYAFSLSSDGDLELLALGLVDGEIQVIELGQSGVVDTGDFESLGLMVFNRAIPEAPGVCSSSSYSIEVTSSSDAVAQASYQFGASHFTLPE
jgi:hypothetical protein